MLQKMLRKYSETSRGLDIFTLCTDECSHFLKWSFVSIRECAYLINKLKSFKLLCSFYIQKLFLMKRLRMPLVLDLVKPEEWEENNKESMSTDCYCFVGKLTCLEIKF